MTCSLALRAAIMTDIPNTRLFYEDVNYTQYTSISLFDICLQVIQGNTNTYLEAKREVDPPVKASKVRILPYSYHRRTVCMRVEIYGCYWKGTKH